MAIVKVRDRIEEYRIRAGAHDPNELSGRSNRRDLTVYVNQEIFRHLSPVEDETIVDIGCGDGTLLSMLGKAGAKAIGVLPTSEEVDRVCNLLGTSAEVRRGVVTNTGCADGMADKVVCNGVLILLDKGEVDQALREMSRISRKGAILFIGEVPSRDEMAGKDYGDSILRWLIHVYHERGMREFLARLRKVIAAMLNRDCILIYPKKQYHVEPGRFINMAAKHGLRCMTYFRHKEIALDGVVIESETRIDYIFQKIG